MRAMLIRGGLAATAILLLGVSWLVTARQLSELVDAAWVVRVASLSPSPFGWNGTWLRFGPPLGGVSENFVDRLPGIGPQFRSLDLTGPGPLYGRAANLAVDTEGRLVLSAGGKSFVLGARTGGHVPIEAADPTLHHLRGIRDLSTGTDGSNPSPSSGQFTAITTAAKARRSMSRPANWRSRGSSRNASMRPARPGSRPITC
jgi:hypothetical protein